MKVEEMKSQSFADVSFDQWKETAEASLKGKPLSRLHTQTYENITLKPLYLPEDVESNEVDQHPGELYFTRGFHKGGYLQKPWRMANAAVSSSASELKEKLKKALDAGQDTLAFSADDLAEGTYSEVADILTNLNNEQYPLYIKTKDHFLAAAAFLQKAGLSNETIGVLGSDVVSNYASKGIVLNEKGLNLQLEALEELKRTYPNVKTLLVDTTPYHSAGGNAVQEIALALSEAVFYLEWLTDKGWTADEVSSKLVFHFAVGSQFFIETAKIRAFRKIWTTLCQAYGISEEAMKVTISAETSEFTLSQLDRHVNILRTGSQAFSAVLGGVEYLQVTPFDRPTGSESVLGARIARNIPMLLRSESHLEKVVDPAGGSYFVESITEEIGKNAWSYFLSIEDKGGILSALKDGTLQNEFADMMKKRMNDLATRKKSMIGTNVYADLGETLPEADQVNAVSLANKEIDSFASLVNQITDETTIASLHVKESGEAISPLQTSRLSEPFEQLRKEAKRIEAKGGTLKAGLIGLGKLKEYKPRADFVAGVLSTGGISVESSGDCQTVEEAVQFVKESGLSYFCICGKDEAYAEFGPELVAELKQASKPIKVDLAGRLGEESDGKWHEAGLDGHLFAGQNLLEKLSSLQSIWKGEESNE
ncbi:methylmalonyl-CoA mutase [Bacillus ectoiniformans]|uniref:methylmalonyl-CoA mutase family protein n=1 Tax=Bacillus ectoiniformans TaxID=1494429 RepID=UPI001959A94F|nr:methylmalonyl-CoA mutase family protein [Bacillus ectoiniformans]MBM7648113.1 methylmalonyl-CoA mutase [Bacillus ectoiniformans]